MTSIMPIPREGSALTVPDFVRRILAGWHRMGRVFPAVDFKSWIAVRRLLGGLLAGAAGVPGALVAASPEAGGREASPLVKVAEHRLLEPRFAAAAAAAGDYLYVSGGSSGDQWVLDSIERFDLRTGKSEPFAQLARGRLWHRMVIVDGALLVLGGDSVVEDLAGKKSLRTEASVERFDLATRARASGPPLPEPRRSFGCVVVGRQIYVVGGCRQSETGTSWSGATWTLDLASGRWSAGAPMPTAREAEAVLAGGAAIIVAGGYDGVEALRTVEAFELGSGIWAPRPPLPRPASAQAAAVLGDVMYLFGHYDDVDQCLAYDLRAGWSEVVAAPVRGARHAAAVVYRDRLHLVGGRTAESADGFATVQVLAVTPPAGAGAKRAAPKSR